jgi:hypothetical protein
MNSFVVKENKNFRLRVEKNLCANPKDLCSINFVSECIDDHGKITDTNTYNFFLSEKEIQSLAVRLING